MSKCSLSIVCWKHCKRWKIYICRKLITIIPSLWHTLVMTNTNQNWNCFWNKTSGLVKNSFFIKSMTKFCFATPKHRPTRFSFTRKTFKELKSLRLDVYFCAIPRSNFFMEELKIQEEILFIRNVLVQEYWRGSTLISS